MLLIKIARMYDKQTKSHSTSAVTYTAEGVIMKGKCAYIVSSQQISEPTLLISCSMVLVTSQKVSVNTEVWGGLHSLLRLLWVLAAPSLKFQRLQVKTPIVTSCSMRPHPPRRYLPHSCNSTQLTARWPSSAPAPIFHLSSALQLKVHRCFWWHFFKRRGKTMTCFTSINTQLSAFHLSEVTIWIWIIYSWIFQHHISLWSFTFVRKKHPCYITCPENKWRHTTCACW